LILSLNAAGFFVILCAAKDLEATLPPAKFAYIAQKILRCAQDDKRCAQFYFNFTPQINHLPY